MKHILAPSALMTELFNPYKYDERRFLEVIERIVDFGFYQNLELPVFFVPANRSRLRNVLERNGVHSSAFIIHPMNARGLCLSAVDAGERKNAVEAAMHLVSLIAEAGGEGVGVPVGPDPGAEKRGWAKEGLADSVIQIAEYCQTLGMKVMIEPMDRYAYKKHLIGPMEETIPWFAGIHEACPNTYINWDSAHEALGGINLVKSIQLAAPYFGQAHLCNAILDPEHPCYGDLHMDVGYAPDFETEGFLSVAVGARILQEIEKLESPDGIDVCYVSVENLGHPGDNLWRKEKDTREFLAACMAEAHRQKEENK